MLPSPVSRLPVAEPPSFVSSTAAVVNAVGISSLKVTVSVPSVCEPSESVTVKVRSVVALF
jgi:hypothetical protein